MIYRRLKTLILFLLVVISLITSYAIWHGTWMVHSEVGLTEPESVAPTAQVPALHRLTMPEEIVIGSGQPQTYFAAFPDTGSYNNWMSVLKSVSVSPLRSVPSIALNETTQCVVFDFPVTLNPVQLETFIPALSTTAFAPATQEVMLFMKLPTDKVQLAIQTDSTTYIATTNLSETKFLEMVKNSNTAPTWHLLSESPLELVPTEPISLKSYSCKLVMPKMSPLVNSFFVNTQVLTRIQENRDKIIWTDGSRAVQWNTLTHQLIFEDPNAVSTGPVQSMTLTEVLDYLRNHGGLPSQALASQDESNSQDNYIFRQQIAGLPLLTSIQAYEVFFQQGDVTEYDRPLLEIRGVKPLSTVKTLTYDQLLPIIKQQNVDVADDQIQLGYALEVTGTSSGTLVPAYFVSNSEGLAVVINASSGQVLEGGSQS